MMSGAEIFHCNKLILSLVSGLCSGEKKSGADIPDSKFEKSKTARNDPLLVNNHFCSLPFEYSISFDL